MVYDTSKQQRAANVEQSHAGGPFEGVGFPVSGAQRHDTRNIEGAGEEEGKRLPYSRIRSYM